jgi:CheY-like chemotaxis protein
VGDSGQRGHVGTATHVLVVDDDADILEFVALALELSGYTVATATNGQEALQALAQQPADLILLDLNMPVMDGHRFCEEKRRHPELDPIPLALMSAAENLGSRSTPCSPVVKLSKPFTLDALLHGVAAALAA